ncbi:MAG TPA: SusD/RagB family nutrient-binding outer membrane lipoprotein [Flavobacterium sp.]|nr:SusD/RagB family nutrient-binding outer membrane lipoprotein [Flavobacterium sp.]
MKKFIFSILVLSTAIIGCNTDLDINTDPDSLDPTKAPLSAQLPAGIVEIVASQGGTLAIIGGVWSQYWTQSNTANQYKDIDAYIIGTADYNFAWDGMYDGIGDLRNVQRKAAAQGNWNYYLISTTLIVQASQILTDFYGDIPYSEAGNKDILSPKFDSQEQIYDQMIKDLDAALANDLSVSQGEIPGNDDLIFQGNMTKWTKFANTLKLKIYMRQTVVRPSVAQAGIEKLLNDNVEFLNEDAALTQFVDEVNSSNPLYEYNNRTLNVATNLRMSRTTSSFLDENIDERKGAYYLAGNPLNQGDYNSTASNIAIVNNKAETPVLLLSKEESLFLQAEALLRYKGDAGAKDLYDQAVIHNFQRYTKVVDEKDVKLDGSPYVAAGGAYEYPSSGSSDDKLEAIIVQKWAASFPGNGFEAFFEKNRTGFPRTSAVPQSSALYIPGQITYSVNGATEAGKFPKRIEYPLSERNANANAPDLVEITVPVWWALKN